jgi:hypothetical protein
MLPSVPHTDRQIQIEDIETCIRNGARLTTEQMEFIAKHATECEKRRIMNLYNKSVGVLLCKIQQN